MAAIPPIVEYRWEFRQRAILPALALVAAAAQLLSGNTATAVEFAVGASIVFVLLGLWGADLTPEGVVMRGHTRRFVPWGEIASIEVKSRLGAKVPRLTLRDGSKARLRAPTTNFMLWDPEFEAKLEAIASWWRGHGQPPPAHAAAHAGPSDRGTDRSDLNA